MTSSTATRAWLACLASVVATAPIVLSHCSGSSSSTVKGTDSGQGGSSSGGSSGSSSGSSGGDDGGSGGSSGSSGGSSGGSADGGSSGGLSDGGSSGGEGGSSGGPSCQVPDGGSACDPGTVPCGGASCNTSTQYCCATADGGGSCQAPNGTCASGVKNSCNEATDCASGSVCCQQDAYGPHSATCDPSCPAVYFQVCRTDAECGVGDSGAPHKCIVQSCPTGPAMGASRFTVEACAYFTPGGGFGGGGTWGPLPACTAK